MMSVFLIILGLLVIFLIFGSVAVFFIFGVGKQQFFVFAAMLIEGTFLAWVLGAAFIHGLVAGYSFYIGISFTLFLCIMIFIGSRKLHQEN